MLAAPLLLSCGLVGCNSDVGGSAALPPSDGSAPPPPLPKESLGRDGRPKDSNAGYDSARGAQPPK
jgi:hypothetical protein